VATDALRPLDVDLLTAIGEDPPGVEIAALVTARLTEPVERQRDRRDREQRETGAERKVELLALEFFVGKVRLPVRGELDLGSDLFSR
jgi:hypothetical protein